MDVGRLAGGGLRLHDGPGGIHLVDDFVQVREDGRSEDVIPGVPQLEERRPALLVGVLEDVAEGGDDVSGEQPLVRVGMVLDDRVHEVEYRQLLFGGDLDR